METLCFVYSTVQPRGIRVGVVELVRSITAPPGIRCDIDNPQLLTHLSMVARELFE